MSQLKTKAATKLFALVLTVEDVICSLSVSVKVRLPILEMNALIN